jgi:hypothetical protein
MAIYAAEIESVVTLHITLESDTVPTKADVLRAAASVDNHQYSDISDERVTCIEKEEG